MKKLNKMFFVLVLVFIIASLFVACNENTTNDDLSDNQFTVTVHPNNGEKAFIWKISDDIPTIEREGYYLDGIYLDSLFMSATSFESLKKTGFDGNLDVYVKWVSHKHEFGSWYILVQPTHITEGLRVWYCSLCDAEKYENMQKIGDHQFSDVWTIDIEPTEISEGEKSHHCIIAGCTERIDITVIPKKEATKPDIPIDHTHSMILVKRVPATCTVTGYEINKCEECGYTSRITLPIVANDLDHSKLLAGEKCAKCEYVSISNLRDSVLMYNAYYDTYCAEYYGMVVEKDIFKYYNQRINLAYLSDTIETISKDSFKDWNSLDHIIIPDSITKIETNAFYGCSLLNEVSIPDSVEEIEESAFAQCINLEKITMSQSLKHIGKNVLWSTKWFENQPSGLLYLGNVAVAIKQGCLKIEAIKEGTRIVADEFFEGQSELSIITIPSTILNFGSKVFDGCSNLTGVFYNAINAECKDNLFGNRTSLEHAVFGKDVEKIPEGLFTGCTQLSNVTFVGNNVKEIGALAFSKCSKIAEIIVPTSVTSIGESTFSGCSSLESITIPFVGAKAGATSSDKYQYPFGYIFGTSSYTGGVATKQYYYGETTSYTTYSTYYIPSSLKSVTVTGENILYGAFYDCSGLTSISIPDNLTSIGAYAFRNCSGLTDITIPASVTSIGDSAFYGCSKLQDIYITDVAAWCNISGLSNLMNFGSNNRQLYLNDELVTSVIIPDGVTAIPSSAFRSFIGLTIVTIGNSVTSIGSYAFYGCIGLTSIIIPDSVTSIGKSVFYNCSGLTSITIPDSVTSIGDSVFSGCSSLECMTLPFVGASKAASNGYDQVFGYIFGYTASSNSSAVSGATYQYYGNSKYYYYYIPSSIKSVIITGGNIPSYAFKNCSGLTSVTIPNSVTSIGDYAFYNCSGLKTAFYAGSEEQWKAISIGSSNSSLTSATRVYNSDGAEHTYSFVTNCEQSVDPITATYLTSLPTLTRDGYHFCGWYDNEAFEGKAVSAPYGNKDKTRLYAKWLTEEEWLALPYNGTSFEKAYIAESGQTYDVTITTGGQIVYFAFTPTTSGSFTIQSTGSGDTYGTLYSSTQSSLTTNDDGGDGSNFKITYTMTAGTTYYIAVKFYGSSTGTFKVSIS